MLGVQAGRQLVGTNPGRLRIHLVTFDVGLIGAAPIQPPNTPPEQQSKQ